MTPAERALMQEHVMYWSHLMNGGSAIVFGPVADPKGSYGICVLRLESDVDAQALCGNDPVIKAAVGFSFEVYPMPRAMLPVAQA